MDGEKRIDVSTGFVDGEIDTLYTNATPVTAEGAPSVKEGAICEYTIQSKIFSSKGHDC